MSSSAKITVLRILALAFALFIVLGIGEVALRVCVYVGVLGYDTADVVSEWERLSVDQLTPEKVGQEDSDNAHMCLSPYLAFIYTPDFPMGPRGMFSEMLALGHPSSKPRKRDLEWKINNVGVPSRYDVPYKKKDNDFVVLILGGSVATCFELLGGTEELERLLSLSPDFRDKNLIFVNGASGGYKAPVQGIMLAYLLSLGEKPDAVINIDGYNEAALGYNNLKFGMSPMYPSHHHWILLAKVQEHGLPAVSDAKRLISIYRCKEWTKSLARWGLRLRLYHSYLIGKLWSKLVVRFDSLARSREMSMAAAAEEEVGKPDRTLLGPQPIDRKLVSENTYIQAGIDQLCEGWRNNSLFINQYCKSLGIPYVHVLQPTLFFEGSKPFSKEERDIPNNPVWSKGVNLIYPKFQAQGIELEKEGVVFCDCSMLFADDNDTLYFDLCHFNHEGHKKMAKVVADAILGEI